MKKETKCTDPLILEAMSRLGKVKSAAKSAASKANGKLGGRPKKEKATA